MKRLMTLSTLFLVAACDTSDGQGASTSGFVTNTGVRVNPVNANVFEVVPKAGARGSSPFWCGAGQYARRALGAQDNARVHVVGGVGPGVTSTSPDTAQFSLLPAGQAEGATGRTGSWGPSLGASKTVISARSGCSRSSDRDLR